ncbi:MAG: hypothetical protein QHJ73_06760 [Armatimonadota bacterium]|nr:hypothetical protein [Armatimonadota bacterium]
MEVTVPEAISRMLRATLEDRESVLYVQAGERTEVILRSEMSERRILQGPPRVFEQLRSRLLQMAHFADPEEQTTREGEILYLVDGHPHSFLIRETRSLLEPNARLITLRYQHNQE